MDTTLTFGAARVQVDDKRIINARADLNQLIPIKYGWAWEKYRKSVGNHWVPQEVAMQADIDMWKDPNGLTAAERKVIKRNLGFFSTADSLVANNIVLGIYRHLTAPECRQYLLRQAAEEAVHGEAYLYIAQSLGLDEGEIFNMYREVPCIADKDAFTLGYTQDLADPSFRTGTFASDQRLLRNLIAYYIVMEGIFFYVGFIQMMSFGRQNRMVGSAEQFTMISKDESLHCAFGCDVINTIVQENPGLWTAQFQQEIINLIHEGVDLEIAYANDTMDDPILGLTAEQFIDYLKFIANRRCKQIGLPEQWDGARNPFIWASQAFDLSKEQNFFERTVTEYQSSQGLDWD